MHIWCLLLASQSSLNFLPRELVLHRGTTSLTKTEEICRGSASHQSRAVLKAGPPLIWVFGHISLLCTMVWRKVRGIFCENFTKQIQRKSWSNVPPKLLACIRFLYKVVHKIGRLRKFNRAREIEFNFFIFWTIFMKLGTLVHHVHGYKTCLRFFNFCQGTLLWFFKVEKTG